MTSTFQSARGENINQAGRDFYQFAADSGFVELTPAPWPTPMPDISPMVKSLHEHRLLIIGGLVKDKASLARLSALALADSTAAGENGPVYQWIGSSDVPDWVARIRLYEQPAIFVLENMTPADIRHNLKSLREALGNKHYVVASTELGRGAWHLDTDAEEPWWIEPTPASLYLTHDLEDLLEIELNRLLNDTWRVGALADPTRYKRTIHELVNFLQDPDDIRLFAGLVFERELPIASDRALNLAREVAENSSFGIESWFRGQLDDTGKSLAIGLCLTEELFEDQCCAIIEQIADSRWGKQDASIRALDYRHLEQLSRFFLFPATADGLGIVRTRIHQQRIKLLKVMWESHRREVLAALEVLVELASKSGDRGLSYSEITFSKAHRRALRASVARTLSDIGRISPRAVERHLLRLAASDGVHLQMVAARAMGAWAQHTEMNLFGRLKDWIYGDRVRESIEQLLELHNSQSRPSGAYIRITVALTVGYAGLDCPPNQLDDEHLNLFDLLAADKADSVRREFGNLVLLWLTPIHLMQLRTRLTRYAASDAFGESVPRALAEAYRQQPQQVLNLLEAWQTDAVGGSTDPTERRNLLSVVASTYGLIRYALVDQSAFDGEAPTPAWGFSKSRRLLETEDDQKVRDSALKALTRLSENYFDEIEPEFQALMENLKADESAKIVKLLTELYLRQRESQPGGDDRIRIRDRRYPIWLFSQRPRTQIETAMQAWVRDVPNQMATKMAYRTEEQFRAALEQEEERRIDELKRLAATVEPEVEEEILPEPEFEAVNLKWWQNRLIVPLATFGASWEVTQATRAIVGTALKQSDEDRSDLLDKYRRDGRDQHANAIARAVAIHKRLPAITIFIALMLLAVWVLA